MNGSCGLHGHEDWVEDSAHEELADGPNDAVEVVAVDVQHDVYALSCGKTFTTSSVNRSINTAVNQVTSYTKSAAQSVDRLVNDLFNQ